MNDRGMKPLIVSLTHNQNFSNLQNALVMKIIFLSHPEVNIDPMVAVPLWSLSNLGRVRMRAFCSGGALANVNAIHTSMERKATDCGEIAREILGVPWFQNALLGEIDRSATGYLPPDEHSEVGREMFEKPHESIRGWETAADAQHRIFLGFSEVTTQARDQAGDLLVVSHGGVGLLLLCKLLGEPISRRHVMKNRGGGCFFTIDRRTMRVLTLWDDMDAHR